MPEGAVYVSRPSKWDNPFIIGKDGTREEVIQRYSEYIVPKLFDGDLSIKEIEGRDLVCWCTPLPCHADILLELANRQGGL